MEEFREMRRKKRCLSLEQAKALLSEGDWGVLSLHGDDGYPYGVPVNYAYWCGKLYIHSTNGPSHKLDAIRRNPKVCMTVVTRHELIEADYTTAYASAVVFGTARQIDDLAEKQPIIEAMLARLAPSVEQAALAGCGNMQNMAIIEITPTHISGKANL